MKKTGKILIIEDDIVVRKILKHHTESQGHSVELAENGQIGLEKFLKEDFDLVLLDIHMPVMDGHEVLQYIKSNPITAQTPVIIISASEETDTIVRCLEAGAEDYLPKNAPPPILNARLNAILQRKWILDAQQEHVDRVVTAMAHIEHGLINVKLETNESDDLYGQLYRGFNMMTTGLQDAASILEVARELSAEINLNVLLKRIMSVTTSLLDAERSTLFLFDEKTDELWSLVAEGMGDIEIRIPSTQGVAGLVFTTGDTLNIDDPYSHPAFDSNFDLKTGYKTESILCMPIKSRAGKPIGVTQVLNKKDGNFCQKDLERLNAFTSQVSVSLDNAKLFKDVMNIKNYNESILKSTSNGLITFDDERNIVTANPAAHSILQEEEGQLVGLSANYFFKNKNDWILKGIARVEESGKEESAVNTDFELNCGKTISMNTEIVPLLDGNNEKLGSMLLIEDITDEKRVKATMARYMSKEVADRLLEQGETELGGTSQEVSILFSDLRKFTSISEKLGPTKTVDLLNGYFSEMVDIIFRHSGILDKYIGDALMAIFGAPLNTPDDADNAMKVANDMLTAVYALNKLNIEKNLAPINIGVGLNTGMAIAGNIGSPKRMEYTVIGDSVNLSARLESANKFYGTKILVSEFTVKKLKNEYLLREIDLLRVKGKTEPITVYEALDHHTELTFPNLQQCLGVYSEAIALYRKKNWKEAEQAFKHCLSFNLNDGPSKIHLQRCQDFLANAPEEEWDGVWTMNQK